ncbi:hypothetical protein [Methanobacterium sp.]|jgi:hypothetical protein|uniref:hypothetical protein n=1 Tax=Methanobacterium sp. TaxID=2164 RepID=UPI0031587844
MKFDDIPAELRWKIATKTFKNLFLGYGAAFRQILDEKTVKNVEEMVWIERGKEVKKIADILKLPSKNAIDISNSLKIVGMIIMGKKEHEVQDAASELVIDHFTTCPNFNAHAEMYIPVVSMPDLCQAYCTSAVESLNPEYTQIFTKRMCAGDNYCESIIGLKK